MKALTMMEHHDTSYLFVVDADIYRRTLTTQGIAAWMVHFEDGAGGCGSTPPPADGSVLHRSCHRRQAGMVPVLYGRPRPSGLSAPPFEVRRRSAIG